MGANQSRPSADPQRASTFAPAEPHRRLYQDDYTTRNNIATNSSADYPFAPEKVFEPSSVDDLVEIVKHCAANQKKVRVYGSGHSWSDLAASTDCMINTVALKEFLEIDVENETMTVEAGVTIREAIKELRKHGLGFPNLGGFDGQTVAGALATGTHGSGRSISPLSAFTLEMTMVLPNGTIEVFSKGHPHWDAVRVHLGLLGIVYSIKVQVRKDFNMALRYETVEQDQFLEEFEAKTVESKFYQALWWPYTTKATHTYRDEVEDLTCGDNCDRCCFECAASCFVPCETDCLRQYPESTPARFTCSTSSRCGCKACVDVKTAGTYEQALLTIAQPIYVEMEYCIPFENTTSALKSLHKVLNERRNRDNIFTNGPIGIRFCKSETAFLSPAYSSDPEQVFTYLSINFLGNIGTPGHQFIYRDVEAVMEPLKGRPHWGKTFFLNFTNPGVSTNYPQLKEFLEYRDQVDPDQLFTNDWTKRVFNLGKDEPSVLDVQTFGQRPDTSSEPADLVDEVIELLKRDECTAKDLWNAIAAVPVAKRYLILNKLDNPLQTKMWEITRDNPLFRPVDMIASLVKQDVGIVDMTRKASSTSDTRKRVSSISGEPVDLPDYLPGSKREDEEEFVPEDGQNVDVVEVDTTGEEGEEDEEEPEADLDDEEVEKPPPLLKSMSSEKLFQNKALSEELNDTLLDSTQVAVFVGRNTLVGNTRFVKRMFIPNTSNGEVYGYNDNNGDKFANWLTGPGYFHAKDYLSSYAPVFFDYTEVPHEENVNEEMPAPVDNRHGLFLFGGLRDYMRIAGPDFYIGEVWRDGVQGNLFAMTADPGDIKCTCGCYWCVCCTEC